MSNNNNFDSWKKAIKDANTAIALAKAGDEMMKVFEEQILLIYEGEDFIKDRYKLNFDKEKIWAALFDDLDWDDIKSIDENTLITMIHDFAKTRLDLWQAPLNPTTDSRKSIKEIALFYIYTDQHLNRNTAEPIAIKEGYKNGETLYQDYSHLTSLSNRIHVSERALKQRIELLEKVVVNLSGFPKAQKKAKDELNTLKSKLL